MKRSVRTMTHAWLVMALFGATQIASAQESGSIVGWGSMVVVPQEELTNLVAVAAGSLHSLGLKADGSIVAWGVAGGQKARESGGLAVVCWADA